MNTKELVTEWLEQDARSAGVLVGRLVLAGTLTSEEAGDIWVEYADVAHALGEMFVQGFDSTNAPR